jgi:hypothetical protein
MNYNSFLQIIPRIFSLRFLSSMFKNYNKNKVKFLIIGFQGFHKVQLLQQKPNFCNLILILNIKFNWLLFKENIISFCNKV